MTSEQAKWASQHDWYIRRYKGIASGYVVEVRCDMVAGEYKAFDDFQALQAWAGY